MANVGDTFSADYPASRYHVVLTGKLDHGAGNAQSTIFVGRYDPNGKNIECVVKAMGPEKNNDFGEGGESTEPLEARAEYASLRNMGPHPNIVKLIAYAEIQNEKQNTVMGFIILEKLDMDLNMFIRRGYYNQLKSPKMVMHDLLSALQHCRSHGIVHTDIKPANIFVDLSVVYKPVFKLGDFASANHLVKITHTNKYVDSLRRDSDEEVTTLHWRAPELMLPMPRYTFTSAIDIWSCGCVFADMLFKEGSIFFRKYEILDQLNAYFKFFGTPNEMTWPGIPVTVASYIHSVFTPHPYRNIRVLYAQSQDPNALDLLCRLLAYDPSKRITPDEALRHAYFK